MLNKTRDLTRLNEAITSPKFIYIILKDHNLAKRVPIKQVSIHKDQILITTEYRHHYVLTYSILGKITIATYTNAKEFAFYNLMHKKIFTLIFSTKDMNTFGG
jgi:hypothetical protein